LPLTNAFAPKNACVDSNVTAAAARPREQPVGHGPAPALCSSSIVGTPRSAEMRTHRTEL
jgi:hypothetical protein